MSHRYRFTISCVPRSSLIFLRSGHRANSFQTADLTELVEIRARQRTFHGAYGRTALSNLGYSLTILRLFDARFYRSLYFILSPSPQNSTYPALV